MLVAAASHPIGHNGPVTGSGKHAGARKAPQQKTTLTPAALGLALGITVAVVGWGYLVYLAIDLGAAARGGQNEAWTYLGVSAFGAVLCLFLALLLATRLTRALGLSRSPEPVEEADAPSSSPPGGRRAAR